MVFQYCCIVLTLDWGGLRLSSFSAALLGRWGLQRIRCLHFPPLSWPGCPILLLGPPGGEVWWDCPETAGAVRPALSVVKHNSESSATVYLTSNSIAKDTARLTVFTRPVFTRPVVNSHQLWDRQTIFTVGYCDSQLGVKYQMEYKHAKFLVHLVSSGLTFTCLGCLKFISDTVKVDGFIGCICTCVWEWREEQYQQQRQSPLWLILVATPGKPWMLHPLACQQRPFSMRIIA